MAAPLTNGSRLSGPSGMLGALLGAHGCHSTQQLQASVPFIKHQEETPTVTFFLLPTYKGRWCQLHLHIPPAICASSSPGSLSPAPLSTTALVPCHLRVTSHLAIVQLTGYDPVSLLQVALTTVSFLKSFGLQGMSPLFCSIPNFSSLACCAYPAHQKQLESVHSVALCLGGGRGSGKI